MQINGIFDFFKTTNDIRYQSLFEMIGEERLKLVVKRIGKGGRFADRMTEQETLDAIVTAFPFLETDRSLPFRELRQILSFVSLLEDLGSFYDKHKYAPQSRYKGHNNLGKRYSNFIVRHSDKDERVELVCRYLGLLDLPDPIAWDQTKRRTVLARLQENNWTVKLAKLIVYVQENGDCYIPIDDTDHASLRRWCYRQLNLFNEGELMEHRMTKLRELGFFECYGVQNNFKLAC